MLLGLVVTTLKGPAAESALIWSDFRGIKKQMTKPTAVAVPQPLPVAAAAAASPPAAPAAGRWRLPLFFGLLAVALGGLALHAQQQTGPAAAGGGGGPRVFSAAELARFNGTVPGRKIMLAVLGEVFDVTEGKRFYAPPSHYAFFSGKDASRVFVTGEFNGTGDVPAHRVADLTDEQLMQVEDWRTQYHEKYKFLGVLHLPDEGFYDAQGQPTPLLETIRVRLAAGRELAARQQEYVKQVPQCNS